MAIQDDFTIHPDSKAIRHISTQSTVYSAVAFYSYLQDVFDEPGFLSYEIPIRFNTPTSFTMLNGWFLDDGDGSNLLQYLTGGGIDTLNYATISDPVVMVDLDTQTSAFVAADLDQLMQIDGSDFGPLLSYKESYPSSGLARIWIRDTNSFGSLVPAQTVASYPGTTGDYLVADYSASGDNIYHNLFTIAAFPGGPNPQVYVYQDHPVDGTRTRIAEWSAFTNWDRGTIDILVTTQLAGTLIDGGNVSTFVRQTADSFTFVESTLTTSGRTPIATETAADEVNITTGEHYLFYEGATSPTFVAGQIISNVAIGIIDTDTAPPDWYAEIVSQTAWDGATGYLILRGLNGVPADTDDIFMGDPDAADPVSIVDSTANVNGSVGDTLLTYDLSGTNPVSGDIGKAVAGGTSGAHRIVRAYQHDEPGGKLCLQVLHAHDSSFDGQDYTGTVANHTPGRAVLYDAFDSGEVLSNPAAGGLLFSLTSNAASSTLISGYSDVSVVHMNGTVTTGAITGTFTEGERVTWNAGANEAVFITGTASPITLGNVQGPDTLNGNEITGDISGATTTPSAQLSDTNTQNFEFPLQTTGALYSVFIEGGSIYFAGRSLTEIYAYLQFFLRDGQDIGDKIIWTSDGSLITALAAEEYIKADDAYSATKAAPFGTLAGGVFFGAQAVWLEGMVSTDNNNIKLTDSTGTLREPFTSITITVSNTKQYDRVAIFLEAGSTELPNKEQYSSDQFNNILGNGTFEVNQGAFPNDTPTSGSFIVVDNEWNKQHRYRYASRNGTTNPGILTMDTEITGTADATTATELLEDAGNNFTAAGVIIGDIIHRTNNSFGFCYVTGTSASRPDRTTDGDTDILNTTLFEDNTNATATTAWSVGDTFAIHSLVKTYNDNDTFFIPYMDEIESADGQIDVALTYVADREIILEVRNVKAIVEIIPFKTTGSITISGYTQGVIRNEDTVIT